jgi:hypothetical protein
MTSTYLKMQAAKGAPGICGEYDLIHVPTGCIVHTAGKQTTTKLMQELRPLDWNFTKPGTIPAKTLKQAIKIIEAANAWEQWQVKKKLCQAKGGIVDCNC